MKSMKKIFTKNHFMLVSLAILMFAAIGFSNPANVKAAAPNVNYSKEAQFMFCPEWDSFGMFCVSNLSKDAKVTVTVSNKKAASAEWDKRQNIAFITAKKPCTIKTTLTIKQNNKTYTYTSKMTWVKYNNPLKSLSVGNSKYKASYFNKNTQAYMKKVNGNQPIKVSLKKGYKLTGLGFSRGGKYKQLKNGSKIKFTPSGSYNTVIFITYTDPKGNEGVLRLFAGTKNQTIL